MRVKDSFIGSVRVLGDRRKIKRGRVTIDETDHDLIIPTPGYDPDESPFDEFDHLWPMQDESLPIEDVNGNLDLTATTGNDPTLREDGIYDDHSIWFDATDHLENRDVSFDTTEPFSMGIWLNHEYGGDYIAGMTLQHTETTSEALGIASSGGNDGLNEPFPKILSVANTPGHGVTAYHFNTWNFYVVRYDPGEHLAEMFFNGEFDYDIVPDDDPDWVALLDEIEFGFREPAGSDYPYTGYMAWAWLTSGLVEEETIRQLYRKIV